MLAVYWEKVLNLLHKLALGTNVKGVIRLCFAKDRICTIAVSLYFQLAFDSPTHLDGDVNDNEIYKILRAILGTAKESFLPYTIHSTYEVVVNQVK